MQTKAIYALIVSAAALTSVGAHADSKVWGFDQIANTPSTVSTTTRAAVKNELLQAQRQGFTTATNYRDYPATPSNSVKTRAQVRSELLQARAEGSAETYQH